MSPDHTAPASPVGRIVTADTLSVAPAILGAPLAEPWRRLTAMGVDLCAIGLLSLLASPWLGLATGALLVVLFGNSAAAPLPLRTVRWICRAGGCLLAFFSILVLGHGSFVREDGLHLDALTGRPPIPALTETVRVAPDASAAELRSATTQLQRQVEILQEEHRKLEAAASSFTYRARSLANAAGVTFGWSGVYFTLLAGAFHGRTPGKILLRIRAVKINGQAFTFFDAFVRHGGYVAGIAMGFIGFLKLLWEPNRQAVEDRIAGTVVVRH